MPRPCICDRFVQGQPYTQDQCRLCYLYHHDPQYKVLWDNGYDTTPSHCPYLHKRVRNDVGEVVSRETDTTCCGKKALDLYHCRCVSRRHAGEVLDTVTLADCAECIYRPRTVASDAKALILRNHLPPGDVLVMTAAIHSLHKKHPGKFLTGVDTSCNQLFEHNPDIATPVQLEGSNAEIVEMHYPLVNESNQRAVHNMQGYCDFLADNLHVPVPLLTNRPMLYLSNEEKEWLPQVHEITGRKTRYWVINAGRKSDYTAKYWGQENFQRLVELLRGRIQFVQAGSAEHHHPALRNVINLVGRTDTRQFLRLVYHSDGAVCGVTFTQHVAAAMNKTCICIMGGREPVAWNSYPRQQLLHTVGMLPCCSDGGCWKSRTVALNDGSEQDKSLCDSPWHGDEPLPRCMALIRPEVVAEAILRGN